MALKARRWRADTIRQPYSQNSDDPWPAAVSGVGGIERKSRQQSPTPRAQFHVM